MIIAKRNGLKNAQKGHQHVAGGLTNPRRYYSVLHKPIEYRANHAGCINTPHGSNPTLNQPVNGLPSIILAPRLLVLGGNSGPTDSSVGLGRFGFLAAERRY
jgi:hypothetical protein